MDFIAQYSTVHCFLVSVVLVHVFYSFFGLVHMVNLLLRGSVRLPFTSSPRGLVAMYYGILLTLLAVLSIGCVALLLGLIDGAFLTVLSSFDLSHHYEFLIFSNPSRLLKSGIVVCLFLYAPFGLCCQVYNRSYNSKEGVDFFDIVFVASSIYVLSVLSSHIVLFGLWCLLYCVRFSL